ncbi:aldehyde dehydrogenase family protein [Corynebacterium glyciniphilum]|uniref:aldehyde dehydrogenase family protein n=1 Tax=Corynebacterium glyciniphilum TaxID=1404244 RepID=UPI001C92EBF0|nr:aldehyde dehydrogenase family protein [Corynebacterium glyciniphilum]
MSNHTFTVRRPDAGATLITEGDLPPLHHYINGAFTDSAGEYTLVNPADGGTIADVPRGSADDVDTAVAAAVTAFDTWRDTTPKDRADLLLAIADRVEANADVLARLEAADAGKPRMVADDDVSGTADIFRFSAGAARAFTEQGAGDYVADHTSMILREPLGVIGAIVPWNYPLLMAAWKIAPILAAGNTLVLKPSEQTPLSMLKFMEIIGDLLPAGVMNVVTGRGSVVGARLSEHPDIAMVALTGSVNSGKTVAESASDSLKRVHLELGGKAPVVIFEDADLQQAAEALREAGYWNSGQECGAGTRVLVHESVAERFTELLVEQVSSLVVGDPAAGEDVEIGPLVSEDHLTRVTSFIDRALADGASAAIGGGALDGEGYYVAPTVLTGVQPGTEAASEEIFGPVVTVETFTTEKEAIDRANEVPYGLAASVFTTDAARSLSVPRRIDAGTVWVNCHLVLANDVPWGGFKGSGYGRDLSLYALQDYSRTKHVQINHERR